MLHFPLSFDVREPVETMNLLSSDFLVFAVHLPEDFSSASRCKIFIKKSFDRLKHVYSWYFRTGLDEFSSPE